MAGKAKESAQIQKARAKIQRQLEAADKKINPDTLARMSLLIKTQLARHKTERINLSKRQVTLFDENRHPARTKSAFVTQMLRQLQKGELPPEEEKHEPPLEGRITPLSEDTP